MTPAVEIATLIQALRAETIGPEVFSGLDHDSLAVSALVLGLAPMLGYRLAERGIELDPRATAKLRAATEAGRKRYAAIQSQLAELLAALAGEGILPIILKGLYLAAEVYPAPELRPMNDLDLLFRPDQLAAVHRVLLGLGYEVKEKSEDLGPGIVKHTRTYRRPTGPKAATPNPYLSPDAERTVEPHGNLEESWFGLRCDLTPGVFDRAVEFPSADHSARALSPEDLLLHLCVHLAFHLIMGSPSFVQLMDMEILLSALHSNRLAPFDWRTFLDRVRETRAAPFVYASLHLARKIWNAPIPAEVERELSAACPAALRRYVGNLTLADVLTRTQQPPLTTIPQRLRRGLQDRRETARWVVGLAAKWRVWRTLFAVARTDTGQMLLHRNPLSNGSSPNR